MEKKLKLKSSKLLPFFHCSFTDWDLDLVSTAAVDGVAVVVTLRCRVTTWCTACQTWTSCCLSAQVGPPTTSHRVLCWAPQPDCLTSGKVLDIFGSVNILHLSYSISVLHMFIHSWRTWRHAQFRLRLQARRDLIGSGRYAVHHQGISQCLLCSLVVPLSGFEVWGRLRRSAGFSTFTVAAVLFLFFFNLPSTMWLCPEEGDFRQATYSLASVFLRKKNSNPSLMKAWPTARPPPL